MRKIGIVFGCFIPMHKGHLKLIDRALKENDHLLLGICGYDEDRGKGFLSFKERQMLIRDKFKDNPRVTLSVVDDKKIGLTGKFDKKAWEDWSTEFFTNAGVDPYDEDIEFTWYTGDPSYMTVLEDVFPAHSFVLIARDGMSGTKIRINLEENESDVDPLFLEYIYLKEFIEEMEETDET